jgi:pimeloyl-ACP methyl ester carboxylesterase
MLRVPSGDRTQIAVHELTERRGDRPLLLFSHATGFHAHCYAPVAELLAGRYDAVGLDHRGHGATAVPPGWEVDWRTFGADVLAVGHALAPEGGLIGVGHSMGGAALLLAAAADPVLFDRLVLFEPVVPSPDPAFVRTEEEMRALPIVDGARRRRDRFESFEAAIANFRDKPPLSEMAPEVLRLYVEHGFRPVESGEVELVCRPEFEAEVFVGSMNNPAWSLLPMIETPTLVVAGRIEDGPSRWSEAVADRLPHGRFEHRPHLTHFGPFSHPAEFAAIIGG